MPTTAFSYVDTTLEKENIWITLQKDRQQFLLIREHFSTQLPHHHMPQLNTGCWEHKNISFTVFLGCDESNNLFFTPSYAKSKNCIMRRKDWHCIHSDINPYANVLPMKEKVLEFW